MVELRPIDVAEWKLLDSNRNKKNRGVRCGHLSRSTHLLAWSSCSWFERDVKWSQCLMELCSGRQQLG